MSLKHSWTMLSMLACGARVLAGDLSLDVSVTGTTLVAPGVVAHSGESPDSPEVRIERGMPISIMLRLTNNLDDRAIIAPALVDPAGCVSFVLQHGDAEVPLTTFRWELEGDQAVGFSKLEPGGSRSFQTFLFGNLFAERDAVACRYLFDEPGQYRIIARIKTVRPEALDLESNTLVVHVGADLQGWDALEKAGFVPVVESLRGGSRLPPEADVRRVENLLAAMEHDKDKGKLFAESRVWIHQRYEAMRKAEEAARKRIDTARSSSK